MYIHTNRRMPGGQCLPAYLATAMLRSSPSTAFVVRRSIAHPHTGATTAHGATQRRLSQGTCMPLRLAPTRRASESPGGKR